MLVVAALGLAGSAGRERDQVDVVAICVDRSETQGDVLQSLLQLAGAAVAVIGEKRADESGLVGGGRVVGQAPRIDDGVADPGALKDCRDLAGTEDRHGGDDDAAGLEDAKPRSEEHTSEHQSLMRISYAVLCLKTK